MHSTFDFLGRGLRGDERAARSALVTLRNHQAEAEFIRFPELAASFRSDVLRLEAHMRAKGWQIPIDPTAPTPAR